MPVMPKEVISGLNIKSDGVYFDGTLGYAGHAFQIVERLTGGGRLIATDKDSEAIAAATKRLSGYSDRVTIVNSDFKNAASILDGLGISGLDGVLLDLGISSPQIDNFERGFSYMQDARLDMRMCREQYLTAYHIVNEYSAGALTRIFDEYGEEKLARRIAERIVKEREKAPIETTLQLSSIVENAYPAATRWKFGHPAKRVFQSLRIETNSELTGLSETIAELIRRLNKNGRIAVISFHSLEDKITKHCFKDFEIGCICPKNFPQCVCGHKKEIEILTKKPLTASEEELKENGRAASAKLRIAEKL